MPLGKVEVIQELMKEKLLSLQNENKIVYMVQENEDGKIILNFSDTSEEIPDRYQVKPRQPTDAEILGQELSEREIQEIIQGQQISDLEIRLLMGGF
jgi:DNA/RNA endonuclease YhcR with UshA esterase domain